MARLGRALPRILILTFAAALVAIIAAQRLEPERYWLTSLAQYLPFPLLLIPAAGAVALSIGLGWLWRSIALASLVGVAIWPMGLELRSTPTIEGGRIRVMTYNVKDYLTLRQDDGLQNIASEVARHDPDIFMLQDARRAAEIYASQTDTAKLLFGDRDTYFFGQFGIASRFPLRDCGVGHVDFRNEAHTYLHCVITAHGSDMNVITAHFMTPREGLEAARYNPLFGISMWEQNVSDRMTQAETLARDLRRSRRPTIVGGDLNAPVTSRVIRTLLDTGLHDTFSAAGLGYGYTWGHSLRLKFSFLRLDHILVSRDIVVGSSFVGDHAGSAHRPVIADLYLPSAH